MHSVGHTHDLCSWLPDAYRFLNLSWYLCGQTAAQSSEHHNVCLRLGGPLIYSFECCSQTCSNQGIDFLTDCMKCCSTHSNHPVLWLPCVPSPALNSHLCCVCHSGDSCCQQWFGQQLSEADVNGPTPLITADKGAVKPFWTKLSSVLCCQTLLSRDADEMLQTHPPFLCQVIMGGN